MKCSQLRQTALETNEYLDERKGVTGLIQDTSYFAIKGIFTDPEDSISFPISGSINIESGILNSVVNIEFGKNIMSA